MSQLDLVEPPAVQSPTPALYDGQREGVSLFINLPRPRRHVFAWDTGVGKTPGAVAVLDTLQPNRVLIITPALVRRHWVREVETWAPALEPHTKVIEWGKKRLLNGALTAARSRAYRARVQVVSYDLLSQVDKSGWDLIIADELHHLANPKAKVSKDFAEILKQCPGADVLGLSATLIPTEAQQIWNPMRLLFPRDGWGEPYRDGGVSWNFKGRYCNTEKTEYGTDVWGVKEEMREELKTRLLKRCHRLTRADISKELPPLDLHTITLSPTWGNKGRKCKAQATAMRCIEWAEANAAVEKLVILVHHRDAAQMIHRHIRETSLDLKDHHIHYVDGSIPTHARDMALVNCSTAPRCVLIGTHDSLLEGIRLMWADQVLIDEWSMSPGRMIQLMGRFNSVGSTRRPSVNLATDEESYGAARSLIYRLQVVSDLMSQGQTTDQLIEVLQAPEQSDEDVKNSWLRMFESANLNADREDWSDDGS